MSSSSRSSSFLWILLILGIVAVIALTPILLCAGFFVFVRLATPRAAAPPPAATQMVAGLLPLEAPFPVDYPNFEGKIEDLVPDRVGRFRRTESERALDLNDAQTTWSAFYRDENGDEIHLRLQLHASPDAAYRALGADEAAAAAVGTKIVRLEKCERNGKSAGCRALGRYRNDVKNCDAEAIWQTTGNLAIIIGSKDGLFAEEFLRDYEKRIRY